MRKILAVAQLDLRRLGFALVSLGLVGGLIPSLASGVGEVVSLGGLLGVTLVIVGLVTGGCLGSDFSEGRSSFFFARPLRLPAFLLGRVVATAALAVVSSLALIASYWLSSPEPILPEVSGPNAVRALQLTINGWAISLYLGLAVAVRDRGQGVDSRPRAVLASLLRIVCTIGAFIFAFGLFADLVVRAYLSSDGVVTSFTESWVLACISASCLAIAIGRTERMTIARIQNLVMFSFLAIACVAVAAAWQYTLHPGPGAIRSVRSALASPDGRFAYVQTGVGRGDTRTFRPMFILDPASGETRQLVADPGQGPWVSADGGTMAWVEATPFFFRPLFWMFGGKAGFKARTGSGPVEELPKPTRIPAKLRGIDLPTRLGWFTSILPSDRGEVFAVRWDRHLTFISRSGVELSDLDFGGTGREVIAASFVSSGRLRVALTRRGASGASLEFADIDPRSGELEPLASTEAARVRFDRSAGRALLFSPIEGGRGTVALIDFRADGASVNPVVLLTDGTLPAAVFLADGRIAATTRGSDRSELSVFSEEGERILHVVQEEGTTLVVRGEMFPGILAVQVAQKFGFFDVALIDGTSGAILRRIPNAYLPSSGFTGLTPAPPGSAAARLIQSDGRLYELPSLTAEPRQLLPLPGP